MIRDPLLRRIYRRLLYPTAGFFAILAFGTLGYSLIGGPQTPTIDALYMTFITVATIGYGEIIDLAHSPGGRVFTMAIATAGILNFTYMMSAITALIVEGDINKALRRRTMQKTIDKLKDHFIVCGIGRVGANVAHELRVTDRQYVVVDINQHHIDEYRDKYPETMFLHGDGSEDDVLLRAGIERAAGVFAITGDDSKNLVITLTCKQINPRARVVARCHEVNYIEKIRRVGADAIVSPDFTGGMRIASCMIRPHVVSFLDEMLRADNAVRVEDVHVPDGFSGVELGKLGLRSADYVLLAVRNGEDWLFNPQQHHEIKAGQTLVVMTTPKGRQQLEEMLAV
jgi:voltage-gated potassium channel